MKNKLTKILIISVLLMFNVSAGYTVNSENTEKTDVQQVQTSENVGITTVDVVPSDNNIVSTEPTITEQVQADVDNSVKIPPTSEIKHVLSKFLKTMLLVLGSCIIIYLVLLGYKRLKSPKALNISNIDIQKNLNSPETIEEATKFFIEKF